MGAFKLLFSLPEFTERISAASAINKPRQIPEVQETMSDREFHWPVDPGFGSGW